MRSRRNGEIESAKRIQILEEAVGVSLRADAL